MAGHLEATKAKSLWRNRDFRLLFGAQLVSLTGSGVTTVGLALFPSSTLLAEHTFEEERGRAHAAHFPLTHACWLLTHPAVGHPAARWGAPATFTAAGIVCLFVTGVAAMLNRGAGGAHNHGRRVESA